MFNTKEKYPFWVTGIEDIEKILACVKKGEVKELCTSAGGRSVKYVTYGKKENYNRRANYSSACGAHDLSCYADKKGKRHTLMLIGATHGQETEGVAGIANLISLIETGRDLRGIAVPSVTESLKTSDCRLVIVPIYNIDGRARCAPDSMIGEPMESLRHYGQGNWRDGTLCGWPGCKKVHPIKESAGFLGAYFNDSGVNLMHDNFFAPMARETVALMKLCDQEAPSCVIGLHGGGNTTNELLQPDYVPAYINRELLALAEEIAEKQTALGLKSRVRPLPTGECVTPPSFNLTSAIHHVCGAVSCTYESNEGLAENNAFTPEEILLHHYCLFSGMFSHDWNNITENFY
ncbi:MAG: hypothetical protein IKB34_01750 [Clostridia bacterium]|nr:hypothetical protein [Clostridia bacterium]